MQTEESATASDAIAPPPVPVEQLQLRQAEPLGEQVVSRRCVPCKSPIQSTYFQAVGKDICPRCAELIRSRQQAPPAHSLVKAGIYGGGAALAGCAIYSIVAIAANLQLALLAMLIGFMVGKAVRHASNGLGGRPQQILAVVLTYFAITFSYVTVYLYELAQKPKPPAQVTGERNPGTAPKQEKNIANFGQAVAFLVLLAAIAPFLSLASSPASAVISLVIIFFGLRKAWRMTGRSKLVIMGPFGAETS